MMNPVFKALQRKHFTDKHAMQCQLELNIAVFEFEIEYVHNAYLISNIAWGKMYETCLTRNNPDFDMLQVFPHALLCNSLLYILIHK